MIPTDVLERYAAIRAFLPDGNSFPGAALACLALAWLTYSAECVESELVGVAEAIGELDGTLAAAHDVAAPGASQ